MERGRGLFVRGERLPEFARLPECYSEAERNKAAHVSVAGPSKIIARRFQQADRLARCLVTAGSNQFFRCGVVPVRDDGFAVRQSCLSQLRHRC